MDSFHPKLIIAFALLGVVRTASLGCSSDSTADAAWKSISTDLPASLESRRLCIRSRGLQFWKEFPRDLRRYEWLFGEACSELRHVKDVSAANKIWNGDKWSTTVFDDRQTRDYYRLPTDEGAAKCWGRRYASMRNEFWNDIRVTSDQKRRLWREELWHELLIARDDYRFNTKQPDLKKLECEALAFSNAFPSYWESQYPAMIFFWFPRDFGIAAPGAMTSFIRLLKKTKNYRFAEYLNGKERLCRLGSQPLELRFRATDGRLVDLNDLRGKIVFVDVWNTGCSVCVSRMPRLKQLYDTYKSKGLEVVGLCLDIDARRGEVDRVLKRLHVTWPTWFTGGRDYNSGVIGDLRRRFSIEGFPTTLLIGREGRLLESNPGEDHLEETLRQVLGLVPHPTSGKGSGCDTPPVSHP